MHAALVVAVRERHALPARAPSAHAHALRARLDLFHDALHTRRVEHWHLRVGRPLPTQVEQEVPHHRERQRKKDDNKRAVLSHDVREDPLSQGRLLANARGGSIAHGTAPTLSDAHPQKDQNCVGVHSRTAHPRFKNQTDSRRNRGPMREVSRCRGSHRAVTLTNDRRPGARRRDHGEAVFPSRDVWLCVLRGLHVFSQVGL